MNELFFVFIELLGTDPVIAWIVDSIDELDDILEDTNSSNEDKVSAQTIKLYLQSKRADRELYLINKGGK